jgi:hypothetical protein
LGKFQRVAAGDLWYDNIDPGKHAPDSIRA